MNLMVDTREFAHGKLPISLSLTTVRGGSGTELLVYDAYNDLVSFYGGVANIPTTVKFGFTAGTGGQNAYHEVRGLRVLSINNVPGYVGELPEPGNWVLMLTGVALLAVYGLRKRPSRRRGETSST